MRVDPHDLYEALIQAPGEQLLELGKEIEALRRAMAEWDRVSPTRRGEVVERLGTFVARTREIEPVVEKLQEVAEQQELEKSVGDDKLIAPTPFMVRQQPPFAVVLLYRLAAARAAGDTKAAGNLRDDIATYSHRSPIPGVRDVLVNGLRLDALAHGETEPGYCIPPLEDVREQLLACVPD